MRRRHLASVCLLALLMTLLSAAGPAGGGAAARRSRRGPGPGHAVDGATSPAVAAACPPGSPTPSYGRADPAHRDRLRLRPRRQGVRGREGRDREGVRLARRRHPRPRSVDLHPQVQDYWDRGLLGLAVDPGFGTAGHNFVYVLYTHDHNPEGSPASWGGHCPSPPGPPPTAARSPATCRASRSTPPPGRPRRRAAADHRRVVPAVPSHSIGHLAFGPDGMLYVTGGDGASFNNTDWGQFGGGAGSPTPANPCGDPPARWGTPLSARPTAEGGALRSQSPRRVGGHPILLGGAVLRVDPATGNGVAGNPMSTRRMPLPTPRGSSATGSATLPVHLPPRHLELWVGRRRLEHLGRRSTG
jgi:hypothetical protein